MTQLRELKIKFPFVSYNFKDKCDIISAIRPPHLEKLVIDLGYLSPFYFAEHPWERQISAVDESLSRLHIPSTVRITIRQQSSWEFTMPNIPEVFSRLHACTSRGLTVAFHHTSLENIGLDGDVIVRCYSYMW